VSRGGKDIIVIQEPTARLKPAAGFVISKITLTLTVKIEIPKQLKKHHIEMAEASILFDAVYRYPSPNCQAGPSLGAMTLCDRRGAFGK
jgi:methyl coenzyme M reductase beta subunit